jgi:hypothetical protein
VKIEFSRSTPLIPSPRTTQVEGIFGMEPATSIERHWSVDLPLDEQAWTIGLVVGPSGSGKSTFLSEAFEAGTSSTDAEWPTVSAVIDGFEDRLDTEEIVRTLSGVGFSSPPAWLRPFHTLSTGEAFRADLARTLLWARQTGTVAVVDEFTSTVDRTVAKTASVAVARLLRGNQVECEDCRGKGAREATAGHCFDIDGGLWHEPGTCKAPECGYDGDRPLKVPRCCPPCSTCGGSGRGYPSRLVAASCHYDIIDWLQPDWLLDMAAGTFTWRSLQPRPGIDLDLRRATRAEWAPFAPHHYLNPDLAAQARCYLGTVDGRPATFVGVMSTLSPKRYVLARESRLVCLPDFQGVGLGHATGDAVAAAYRARGWRYRSVTSHPAMIGRRARSPLWDMVRPPSFKDSAPGGSPDGPRVGSRLGGSSTRRTATFEYVGPWDTEAAELLEVPVFRMPS